MIIIIQKDKWQSFIDKHELSNVEIDTSKLNEPSSPGQDFFVS